MTPLTLHLLVAAIIVGALGEGVTAGVLWLASLLLTFLGLANQEVE